MDAMITREEPTATPQWKPLSAIDRRIVGVLIEKAKTTADQYPLTITAIKAGANQKSNRAPVMQLDTETLTDALDRLRAWGVVTEVQGGGRVPRYRHQMYAWLGVNKVELAVMTELLLRGAQTVGELRGRAARMEPIADLASLRPHVASLCAKGLLIRLTPDGRGCVVTHALYPPEEFDRLRAKYPASPSIASQARSQPTGPPQSPRSAVATDGAADGCSTGPVRDGVFEQIAELRDALKAVRAEVDWLKQQWVAHATTGQNEANPSTP